MLLNIDLGELPSEDTALYQAADLANIACGGHTGDADSMRKAVSLCLQCGTQIGAHPSFPDREGFGRRALDMSMADLHAAICQQVGALKAVCDDLGAKITHIKPHGALYHAADKQASIAEVLLAAARSTVQREVAVLGPLSGELQSQAEEQGWPFFVEGFADRGRRRNMDGRWELVPRGEPAALLTHVDAVLKMLEQHFEEAQIDTVCLHGDNPQASLLAPRIRSVLDQRRSLTEEARK